MSGDALPEEQTIMVRRQVVAVVFAKTEASFLPPLDALFRPGTNLHGRPAGRAGFVVPVNDGQHTVRLEYAEGLFHQGNRLFMVQDIEEQGSVHGVVV